MVKSLGGGRKRCHHHHFSVLAKSVKITGFVARTVCCRRAIANLGLSNHGRGWLKDTLTADYIPALFSSILSGKRGKHSRRPKRTHMAVLSIGKYFMSIHHIAGGLELIFT